MQKNNGFTLVELLVVIAIIGVLATIAIPAYSDYITKSKLTEAFNALSETRMRMEQYYQDNRRYTTAASGTTCGATMPAATTLKYFTVTCTATDTAASQTYTLTATGKSNMTGFAYTLTDQNTKATTATPTSWGSVTGTTCWISTKHGSCS